MRPITLVNITRIIHKTALSMPRAFASRATHIKSAMFKTMMTIGISMIVEQTAQPPAAASGLASCDHPYSRKASIAPEKMNHLSSVFMFLQVHLLGRLPTTHT